MNGSSVMAWTRWQESWLWFSAPFKRLWAGGRPVYSSRMGRVEDLLATPEDFARRTGAMKGFSAAHAEEWIRFWKYDVCERDEFQTAFDVRSLTEARAVWLRMEKEVFERYEFFLRVWAEDGSSGIWVIRYPGSRAAGGNLSDYGELGLSEELIGRFKAWQGKYDEIDPWDRNRIDWRPHDEEGRSLARALKGEVGDAIYVEFDPLMEILADGTEKDWREDLLGRR